MGDHCSRCSPSLSSSKSALCFMEGVIRGPKRHRPVRDSCVVFSGGSSRSRFSLPRAILISRKGSCDVSVLPSGYAVVFDSHQGSRGKGGMRGPRLCCAGGILGGT